MEKYEKLAKIGSGSYGIVIQCRHKVTGRVVAIKKFFDTDEDPQIRKIASREVKILKMLNHGNLVALLEVFKRRKKYHMVFEYIERTVLDELEQHPQGLPSDTIMKITYQVLKGIDYCHSKDVVHRDIKPENILISPKHVVKLCDFGFARRMDGPVFTDYVATRWYRAPELLVGDTQYGPKVDVWAIGCLFCEMLTGQPLWPGTSDIDQMYCIMGTLGPLLRRHVFIFDTNSFFKGFTLKMPSESSQVPLSVKYKHCGQSVVQCRLPRGIVIAVSSHGSAAALEQLCCLHVVSLHGCGQLVVLAAPMYTSHPAG
eukprot:m.115796 g.115796  ORF g.115796 m.115796 type:complete len:314 (-) comp17156_c0_seq9:2977-3918(-)